MEGFPNAIDPVWGTKSVCRPHSRHTTCPRPRRANPPSPLCRSCGLTARPRRIVHVRANHLAIRLWWVSPPFRRHPSSLCQVGCKISLLNSVECSPQRFLPPNQTTAPFPRSRRRCRVMHANPTGPTDLILYHIGRWPSRVSFADVAFLCRGGTSGRTPPPRPSRATRGVVSRAVLSECPLGLRKPVFPVLSRTS